MVHLTVLQDGRSADDRKDAIDAARGGPTAIRLLGRAVGHLERALGLVRMGKTPRTNFWDALDSAYEGLDAYLSHLSSSAELEVSCGPGCGACCTDLPPAHAIEGLRMARALRHKKGGAARIQRAVARARSFQSILQRALAGGRGQTKSRAYLDAQLAFRKLGQQCEALGDDGSCAMYTARPMACRIYVSVENPEFCDPHHARFALKERPPLWVSPEEARFEELLKAIGQRLGLPSTPNLAWAVASLHGHPLAQRS